MRIFSLEAELEADPESLARADPEAWPSEPPLGDTAIHPAASPVGN